MKGLARRSADGQAWTPRFHRFDLLGNTTADTDAGGMVGRRSLLFASAVACWWDALLCAYPIRGTF